jgi:integral membrane protein
VIDLATRMRWSWGRGIVIALAGTVPFLSFVAEHKVTLQTRAQLAAA